MKKIFFIAFILAMAFNLSKSIDIQKEINPYSKLIGKVRKEVIDKSLFYLPKRDDINILQMLNQMKNAKEEFSLNEAESAYFAYKWISKNIEVNEDSEKVDPAQVYQFGEGNPEGIASLFNRICSFLKLETDSISGIFKLIFPLEGNEISEHIDFTWNYALIDGEYYLIDVSIGILYEIIQIKSNLTDSFFGTDPEIFIRNHFPKESKWQLLPEPITLEKFDSMPFFHPFFYLFDIKNISPETKIISGSGKITFTYDESIEIVDILSFDIDTDFLDMEYHSGSFSNGKAEIEYNIDKNQLLTMVSLVFKDRDEFIPILYYLTDNSKRSSVNLRGKPLSNFKIKNINDLA